MKAGFISSKEDLKKFLKSLRSKISCNKQTKEKKDTIKDKK